MSLTHNKFYPAKNLQTYNVHLNNGDFINIAIDNHWDDINVVELKIINSEKLEGYSGEYIEHNINNKLE